jgi:hypothetical protein
VSWAYPVEVVSGAGQRELPRRRNTCVVCKQNKRKNGNIPAKAGTIIPAALLKTKGSIKAKKAPRFRRKANRICGGDSKCLYRHNYNRFYL